MLDITVKIGGEAGFGIMTTGLLMGKIATRSGYHAFEYPEYPSLIRGGHNVIEIRISDEKVYSQEKKVDILVCLNKDTYLLHKNEVKEGGIVILDESKVDITKEKISDKNITYINLPLAQIIQEAKLSNVMINNIALGAIVHVAGADFKILEDLITQIFAKKGQEVIDKNEQAAKLGLDHLAQAYAAGYQIKIPRKTEITPRMYVSGNEMIGLAAIAAGCKFYCAYPMTPSSALLHFMAGKAEKHGLVVKHAEDEIAVINMAVGASWAGARSMVGTSGGGFALMVEGVSLAGITETPIVIIMGQRPGPATGMPTWTEQGDLLFIIHEGHGEFPKIVLAPGDAEEAYRLTREAFNFADIYQTPVFIMGDKYIQEGHQSVDEFTITNIQIPGNRGKLLTQDQLISAAGKYQRYALSPDGISPRALPGMKNSLHQSNSYEHREDGHTTEEAGERVDQVNKRNKKLDTFLENHAKLPVIYGSKEAPLTLISSGSMKAPILQAMKDSNYLFNYLHFSYIWPLPKDQLTELLMTFKSTLLVENNSQAQLGQLITMVTG